MSLFLAETAGIWSTAQLILYLLTVTINRNLYMNKILGKLFMMNISNEKVKNTKKEVKSEEKNYYDMKQALANGKIRKENINSMLATLLNKRSRFKRLSALKFVCFSLTSLLCPVPRKRMTKEQKLFKNGISKFYQEIDIINILKTVRTMKVLIWT